MAVGFAYTSVFVCFVLSVPLLFRFIGAWVLQITANHDLQRVKHYVKTHANQCKSLQIRLQIKVLFPEDCNAPANHDLRLDLQLANHDLQSANHTLGSIRASYDLHVCSLGLPMESLGPHLVSSCRPWDRFLRFRGPET